MTQNVDKFQALKEWVRSHLSEEAREAQRRSLEAWEKRPPISPRDFIHPAFKKAMHVQDAAVEAKEGALGNGISKKGNEE